MDLQEKIRNKTARIGVIGLGYVGLPLAVEFAREGFDVTGFDVDRSKVEEINAGRSYILDVATKDVADARAAGRLRATTDMSKLHDMDVIDICVPTPLRKTRDPDLSYVVQAVDAVKAQLRRGQLVILESTTYPGTTDEVVQPALEETGLKAGEDFFLAFSPERVDPGNQAFQTQHDSEGCRRHESGEHGAGRGALRISRRHGRAGELDAGRRDGQAAREHVPRRQHRPGERNRPDVRTAWTSTSGK